MSEIKTEIDGLKDRLENLEENIENKIDEVQKKEEKWRKLDEEVLKIKKCSNEIVKFNVSGECFATRQETLLKDKDHLFYKMIVSKKFDLSKEIFIDRSSYFFGDIINYIRTGKINYEKYNSSELEELKLEADYYELLSIVNELEDRLKEPTFINFTFSGPYMYSGAPVGTNKLEDINDRNLNNGICATTPGWIIFELNNEFEISSCEVGGYNGNTTAWGPTNGSNAQIMFSKDGKNFNEVGRVPSNFGSTITNVSLNRQSTKFVKISHTSYLGIGYFKVIKA